MGIRSVRKQQTREAVIDATLDLLRDGRPFASLSLREIARHAGIAPASFYGHFDDISALALALVDEVGRKLRLTVRSVRQDILTERDVFRISVEAILLQVEENTTLFRLALQELTGSGVVGEAIRRELDAFVAELAEDLRRARKEIGRPHLDYPQLSRAMVMLVLVNSIFHLSKQNKVTESQRQELSQHLQMLILGAERLAERETCREKLIALGE